MLFRINPSLTTVDHATVPLLFSKVVSSCHLFGAGDHTLSFCMQLRIVLTSLPGFIKRGCWLPAIENFHMNLALFD